MVTDIQLVLDSVRRRASTGHVVPNTDVQLLLAEIHRLDQVVAAMAQNRPLLVTRGGGPR